MEALSGPASHKDTGYSVRTSFSRDPLGSSGLSGSEDVIDNEPPRKRQRSLGSDTAVGESPDPSMDEINPFDKGKGSSSPKEGALQVDESDGMNGASVEEITTDDVADHDHDGSAERRIGIKHFTLLYHFTNAGYKCRLCQ